MTDDIGHPALAQQSWLVIDNPFLIGAIPLALIFMLFLFDLFTWKRPLIVTVLGGVITWAFDPLTDAFIPTPLAQQITLWAQHHP